jgi:hypothetical protein
MSVTEGTTNNAMRAMVAERFGGPEVLRLSDRDVGQSGPGQLLVDVSAAGVNFMTFIGGRVPRGMPSICRTFRAARVLARSRLSVPGGLTSSKVTGSRGRTSPAAVPSDLSSPHIGLCPFPTASICESLPPSCCRA